MTEPVVVPETLEVSPPYFSVSATKFLVMWVCSFGLYGIYWSYMQWSLIKKRERSNILPAMRSLFLIFFFYSLIQHVNATARSHDIKGQLSAGMLTSGFILFSILGCLPDPYWIIGYMSLAFVVAIQNLINQINIHEMPEASRNESYSGANIALIVIGGFWLLFALIAAFASKHLH